MRISDWSSDVCSSDLEIASGSAVHNLSARGLVGFARKQVADLALHEIRILPLRAAREVAWVEVVVVPRACHGNEVGGAGVLELVIAADDCHVFEAQVVGKLQGPESNRVDLGDAETTVPRELPAAGGVPLGNVPAPRHEQHR